MITYLKVIWILILFIFLGYHQIYCDWEKHMNKGKEYLENCRYKEKEALAEFEKAYQIKPDDFETLYWLGRAYYDNRMYEEAKEKLEKAVELKPKDLKANAYLAYTYGRIGENILKRAAYLVKSANQLRKVMEIDPNFPDAYFSFAVSCIYLGIYEKPTGLYRTIAKIFFKTEEEVEKFNAENLLKKAISLDPNNAWYWVSYGWYYLKREKPLDAKKMFEKALSLAEKDVKCNLKNSSVPRGIAIYYEEAQMWDEALKYARIALQWNPKDLCLDPKFSIKRLISRLEEEKRQNKLLMRNVADEL